MTEDDALALLHDRITETLLAKLPGVVHVEAYPDLDNRFNVPAIFFGMPKFSPGTDDGSGKTAINGSFEALILVDATEKHAPVQGMWLSARVASLLRGQYWGLDFVEETKDVTASLVESGPGFEAFVTWGVSWTQTFHVGDAAEWPWPELQPKSFEAVNPEAVEP